MTLAIEHSKPHRLPHTWLPRRVWIGLLMVVSAIMLFAGLRPYANYTRAWVEFDDTASVTQFKGYGLAVGELDAAISAASINQDLTIAMSVRLVEPEDTYFRILAQLDSPGSADPLIIGQWQHSVIAINSRDYRNQLGLPRVSANLESHTEKLAEVYISFGPDESRIEVNGKFAASGEAFSFKEPLTRISIGNAPDGQHGWIGALDSFSINTRADNEETYTYLFNANHLPDIANASQSDNYLPDNYLTVPSPGKFPDRVWIEAMGLQQLLDQNLRDVVINFLGFAPFGFVLSALLMAGNKPVVRSAFKVVLISMVAGLLFSLFIEVSQIWIPGRHPHSHDLLLNTLGTLPGSIGYLSGAAILGWILSAAARRRATRQPGVEPKTAQFNRDGLSNHDDDSKV